MARPAAILVLAPLALATSSGTACPPTYEVVGQLRYDCPAGVTMISPNDMNDQRQVVGRVGCATANMPFIWTPDDGLQILPGFTTVNIPGSVEAINESGMVTGYYVVPQYTSGTIPFTYTIGDPTPIPLGAPDASGWPFQGGAWGLAINEAGVVAGRAPDETGHIRACVWESPVAPTFIPETDTSIYSVAYGISNSGLVGFYMTEDSGPGAWTWELDSTESPMHLDAPNRQDYLWINDMNADGLIAAQTAHLPPDIRSVVAVLWDGQQSVALPTPPETEWSSAWGVTDSGVVYGTIHGDFDDGYNTRGVIWEAGVAHETRFALGPDISVGRPRAMNNNGDFVAPTTAGYLVIGRIHFQPADLDCDQAVGFSDLLHLLAQWGPCSDACTADFDGDGEIAMSDLEMLVGAWSDL